MNVAENLYEYLKHNDRAEVFGLGTFYTESSSAQINDLTGVILPPSRTLHFTKECTGDNAFTKYMAQTEFISEETARVWISQYSDSVREKVEAGRNYPIGRLGTISKGLLDGFDFTADKNLSLMDEVFAMGELKGVKTFDYNPDAEVELIRTKPERVEEPEEEPATDEPSAEEKIEKAEEIKEEERIQETTEETETRIIQHSEAKVESEVKAPVAAAGVAAALNVDATPAEDKTEKTIEEAAKQKDNIIVEDIKPLAEDKDALDTAAESTKEEDAVNAAEELLDNHNKEEKKKKKGGFWKILLWIILALIILCGAFVGAHWMGWLKNISFLKPVTDKLACYIPVRENKEPEAEKPLAKPAETATETDAEETDTEEMAEIPQTPYAGVNAPAPQPKKAVAKKTAKKTAKKAEKPAQTTPAKTEDKTPVLTQNYSKLGFDVVGGSYADKSKAETQARKAKSLGYDGYVISKIKSGNPVYYVSYGSRRTMSEATDLMQNIMTRVGGSYTVISR